MVNSAVAIYIDIYFLEDLTVCEMNLFNRYIVLVIQTEEILDVYCTFLLQLFILGGGRVHACHSMC